MRISDWSSDVCSSDLFNQRAAAHGLSLAQWRALAFLARQQGVNQVTLADRLEIQPITLARLIDRLQVAGLVARRPEDRKRRVVGKRVSVRVDLGGRRCL